MFSWILDRIYEGSGHCRKKHYKWICLAYRRFTNHSQTNFVDKSPVLTISNYLNTHGVDHIQ